mmetsp:Transcript_1574/g.3428  ORF Transcript_1574/g.3428 Transcript_1574/m.3428 type:complete len:233 (-) Transcript_1574:15-713(-)
MGIRTLSNTTPTVAFRRRVVSDDWVIDFVMTSSSSSCSLFPFSGIFSAFPSLSGLLVLSGLPDGSSAKLHVTAAPTGDSVDQSTMPAGEGGVGVGSVIGVGPDIGDGTVGRGKGTVGAVIGADAEPSAAPAATAGSVIGDDGNPCAADDSMPSAAPSIAVGAITGGDCTAISVGTGKSPVLVSLVGLLLMGAIIIVTYGAGLGIAVGICRGGSVITTPAPIRSVGMIVVHPL